MLVFWASALKMEAVCPSETLASTYKFTWVKTQKTNITRQGLTNHHATKAHKGHTGKRFVNKNILLSVQGILTFQHVVAPWPYHVMLQVLHT
jgi:hypothetical protein